MTGGQARKARWLLSALALVGASCSAIVTPDTRRLGGSSTDAAVPPGTDATVPDTGGAPTEMVPSNVDPALLTQGTRDLSVEVPSTIDTSTCMATTTDARVITQAGGSEVCALIVRDVRIAATGGLRATGYRPLVILASGEVVIEGVIDVSSRGSERGAGGQAGGVPERPAGDGIGRGLPGGTVGVYDDGGGGGGGLCGSGGDGGRGGRGEPGTGGMGISTTLEPLLGGGGGGMGPGGARPLSDGNYGVGGAGGGGLQISARRAIRLRGRILAGGGGGGAGQADDRFTNWGSGGGGGGGGGVLLEAPVLEIASGAAILATGGGGGSGSSRGVPPARGVDGRDLDVRAAGGVGSGEYGASGGASGGGAEPEGLDGATNELDGANGGGGGGGAGCIVLRAAGGAMVPAGARLSPSRTGLVTLPVHTR